MPVIFQPVFPRGAKTVTFAVEGDGKFFVKIHVKIPVIASLNDLKGCYGPPFVPTEGKAII